jgi:hypothetical protein
VCTVVVLRRPGFTCLAANRDERLDRAWEGPCPVLAGPPGGILGGRDRLGGGTWLGLNERGVAAAVLNRPGSLGPEAGKRSRGELPLLALAPARRKGRRPSSRLDAAAWRPFHMVVADRDAAFFLCGMGEGRASAEALPRGRLDGDGPSAQRPVQPAHGPAPAALPGRGRPGAARLGRLAPAGGRWGGFRRRGALRAAHRRFGTVCSSLIHLGERPEWLFSPGPPDRVGHAPLALA